MSKRRGRNASHSGRYGEDTVESFMELAGFPVCSFREYEGATPMAVRQYPAPHPYRPGETRAGKNDFMLFTGLTNVYCQVKHQNVSGTTDEKLAFAFDIARFAVADIRFDTFAMILLGQWWPKNTGIIDYCTRKCSEFEMLAGGTRQSVEARLLVGPKELGKWLATLPKQETVKTLFNKRQ